MVELEKLIPGKSLVRVNETFTTKRCRGKIGKVISVDDTDDTVRFECDGERFWARLDSLDYADPPRPEPEFHVGQRVEYLDELNKQWLPGVVDLINYVSRWFYLIKRDGDSHQWYAESSLRALPDIPPPEPGPSVRVEYETKRTVKSVTFEVTLSGDDEIDRYLSDFAIPARYDRPIREAIKKDESK